jgi:acyl carrier protein
MADTIPSDARRTLDAIVRESLGLGDDVDLNGVAYHEIPEWDSVAHIQLIADLEAAFDISITNDDVLRTGDYQSLCRLLAERYGISTAS